MSVLNKASPISPHPKKKRKTRHVMGGWTSYPNWFISSPCPSLSTAAVIKMLRTFLNTWGSKIELGCPPFQARIIMALTEELQIIKGKNKKCTSVPKAISEDISIWKGHTCKHRMKKLHILSKLLNICQYDRISTKLTFPTHRSLVVLLSCISKYFHL